MKCLVQTLVQCCTYIFLLTLIIVVIKADNFKINNDDEKVNSDHIDTDISVQNNWRAINRKPEELIVPYDSDSSEITVTQGERYDRLPRRRRIVRKGKRRLNPYTGASKFTDNDEQQYEKNFRIIRSQRPSQYLRDQEDYAEEHWQGEAFAEEQLAYQRPYQKRRRKIPVFVENLQDESDTIDSSIEEHDNQKPTSIPENSNSAKLHFSQYRVSNDASIDQNEQYQENKSSKNKSYRKPYSAHRNQKTNDESNETVPNLKTLLKQREGSLSLVELLQEKNLSLADLLKGKENAISALKQNSTSQSGDNFNGNLRNKSLGVTKSMHVYQEKVSTQENEDIEEPEELEETEGEDLVNRRLPPAASRLTIITNYDKPSHNDDQLAMKEYMNAQRKRLSSLRMDKENRAFSQVKQFDVVTEATTEKRIFVPSKHSTNSKKSENLEIKESPLLDLIPQTKYKPRISEDSTYKMFKPSPIPYSTEPTRITTQKSWTSSSSDGSNVQNELITKFESTSTTARYINPDLIIKGNGLAEKRNHLALKPRLRLPTYFRPDTFEKKVITTPLPKITTSTTTTRKLPTIITELPAKAFTIDIKEIAGINNFLKKTKSESNESDGPLRISMKIDSENLFTREEKRTTPNTFDTSGTPDGYNDIDNEDNNDLSTIFNIPNDINLNIKDELMEILKDNNRRIRLAKILSLRNMTFAELIALRERGSSQLHLADIFHNKSKEPTAAGNDNLINTINTIENKTFFTKPSFVRNPIAETSRSSESTVTNYLKHSADLTDYTSLINTIPSNNVDLHSVRMPKKQNIYKLPTPDVDLAIQSSLIDVLNQQKTFNNMEQTSNTFQKHDEFVLENITSLNATTENRTKLQEIGEKLNTIEDNMADEIHSYYSSINSKPENTFLQEEEEDYMQLSSGVRSAIFASSAIIAGSIIVFMTIFFIFKWQQKRQQLRYITRFNALGARRFPILQKSMIRKNSGSDTNSVVVNVTASSKNLLLNTEVMEEQNQHLWNSLRKPYP